MNNTPPAWYVRLLNESQDLDKRMFALGEFLDKCGTQCPDRDILERQLDAMGTLAIILSQRVNKGY